MIHGNQQAVDILQRYITSYIQAAGKARPSFFILSGPTHLGKTTAALHIIKQLLGSTITNDFLHIQDFSNILGKKHELKVKKPEKNPFLELPDGTSYEDKGMRDISARLQQSYVGTAKVVLLENIERMTLEAANAFLKISEEPLTNRIIIATTSHISQVVDTIVSRAIVIPFYPLTDDQILAFLQDKQIFTSPQEQDIAISRALGRPGILMQLHEYKYNSEDSGDPDILQQLSTAIQYMSERNHQTHILFLLLQQIQHTGYLHSFLDALIAYQVKHKQITQAQQRLQVKKLLRYSIKTEHVLLYGLL